MKKLLIILLCFILFSCSKTIINSDTQVENIVNSDTQVKDILNKDYSNLYKLLDEEKFDELEKVLINEDQDKSEIVYILAKTKFGLKKYDESLNLFQKADKLFEGKNADVIYMIGVNYHNKGDIEKAKEFIDKALVIDSKLISAIEYKKILLNNNNLDYGKYYKLLDELNYIDLENLLSKENQNDPEIVKLLAKSKFGLKKYDESLILFQKANKLFEGKNADIIYSIGVVYSNKGDIEKAKEFIDKALVIDSKFGPAIEYKKLIDSL